MAENKMVMSMRRLSKGRNRTASDAEINVKGGNNSKSSKKVPSARFIPANSGPGSAEVDKKMNTTPPKGKGRRGTTPPKKSNKDNGIKKLIRSKHTNNARDAKDNQNDARKKRVSSSKMKNVSPRPTWTANQKRSEIPVSLPKSQSRKAFPTLKSSESLQSSKASYKSILGLRPNKTSKTKTVQRDAPTYLTFSDKEVRYMLSTWRRIVFEDC